MLEAPQTVSYTIAFTAGFLSFVSPCVLPLVPAYISYITGLSLEELTDSSGAARVRWVALKNSLLFILGFSLVFIAFGASATAIGQMFLLHQDLIRKIGGLLIILFGLYLIGALKIPFLMAYKQYHFQSRPAGAVGSVLIGITFAAAWTPCVGPILGSVYMLAGTSQSVSDGVRLLAVYSIGLGLPLLIAAMSVSLFLSSYRKMKAHMWIVSLASGIFLILVGTLVFTNSLRILNAWLTRYGIGWTVGQ
ncbi:MAG: sulfite exporter TauE/SafE family protein [Nitrospirae bacterium]|nr:sulfite exporter TauE/SafE family protein [Nitrospirota bacterium]